MNQKSKTELNFQRQWAPEYLARPGVVLAYWARYRAWSRLRGLTGGLTVDVGCGVSSVLRWLPGRRVGVDPLASEYAEFARWPHPVVAASGESLPFAGRTVDTVVSSNALDHTDDPRRVLSEIRRVLRGRLFLTVEIRRPGPRDAAHPHSLSVPDVLALLDEAGFVVQWSDVSPWIGLRRYAQGHRSPLGSELLIQARVEP